MNTNQVANNAAAAAAPQQTPNAFAALVTLPPLAFGEHKAAIVSYEQVKTSTNGKEYITISFKFDDETQLRKKAFFLQDLVFLGQGIGQQLGIYGDIFTQLNDAMGQIMTINVVEKVDEVNGRTYVNWQYMTAK